MDLSSRKTRDKGMLTILAILSVNDMRISAFHHPYSSWFFVPTTPPARVAPLPQRRAQLCLSSSPGNEVIGTKKTTIYSIESLLDDGDIDGALLELKRLEGGEGGPSNVNEVAAAAYHSVIEACCAGGYGQDQGRKKVVKGFKTRKVDLIDVAEDLLQSMNNATAHAYETVISGYARRGKWSDALQKLNLMEEEFRPIGRDKSESDEQSVPSLSVYQAVLVACARAGQYDNVASLLTKMRRRGVRPNVYTYNSLLNVCAKDKETRWKEALSLLSQCQREPGIDPDLVTYTTAMRACIRGRRSDKAIEIFRVVKDMGIELDVYCYTTAMDACAKGRMWKTALSILREMKEKGIEPNEVTYGVAVAACGNGGQWEKALELLDQMREMNMKINTITYNSAISALAKAARTESKQQRRFDFKQRGGQYHAAGNQPQNSEVNLFWRKTLDLLDCMESEGVLRDSFTFSSAISTCGAAGRWEEAMNLINTMKANGGRGMKPNRFAYTSAITACGNSGEWKPALKLFKDMKLDGLQPDLVSYNALIGAGMTANQPEQVFGLWNEMLQPNKEKIAPDVVTLTEVIGTLDRATGKINRDRADKVFSDAVGLGIILREDSLDSSWEFDLSGMSFPVARAACRFIFRRLVEEMDGKEQTVRDLSLITGASRMREYVREVLRDELKPAIYCVVPKSEQGTLVVKEKVVRNYIDGNL